MMLSPDMAERWKRVRFNPISSLTPQTLTRALDNFEAGHLRDAALIWDTLEKRDGMIKICQPKRCKSVSRRPWTVLTLDQSERALAHKATLEDFYNHLSVTDALDQNARGGFSMLIRQMMGAEFHYYAAHEIVWKPMRDALRAEFRHVPLCFFENKTGRLRFTGPELSSEGRALEEDGWLITTGDGISEALSIAYIFKRFSLNDWLSFSEKFGIPGIHGECPAAFGSAEWNQFASALTSFANDWIAQTSAGHKINLIETGKTGDAPFKPMVEYMDQVIAALCRGADLSTISKRDGAGASLQGDETNLLLEDDCASLSETLNIQVDRLVIRYTHGDESPLAYVRIEPPQDDDTRLELEIDRFLLDAGLALDEDDMRERYGRPAPEGEDGVRKAEDRGRRAEGRGRTEDAANDADSQAMGKFLASARIALGEAFAEDTQPLRKAVEAALQDEADFDAALEALRQALPKLAPQLIEAEATAAALAEILGTALVEGLAAKAATVPAENANPFHDDKGRFTHKNTGTRADGARVQGGASPGDRENDAQAIEQKLAGDAAISQLLETQADVPDAMRREELGWIDFRVGDTREGAVHIQMRAAERLAKFHDGITPEIALRKMPEVIAFGELTASGRVAVLEHKGWRALLARDLHGKKSNRWLLSGYDISERKAGRGGSR